MRYFCEANIYMTQMIIIAEFDGDMRGVNFYEFTRSRACDLKILKASHKFIYIFRNVHISYLIHTLINSLIQFICF